MDDAVKNLKNQARILQREIKSLNPSAILRVRTLSELENLNDSELAGAIRRRHCLAVIAGELGFHGWSHALAVLSGAPSEDFGTLLYPPGADVHWNIWSASYDEAKRLREQTDGYLLAYRRHFFITDRHFIETLGLDPEDSDWEGIGRDWARPKEAAARGRLYAKLIAARTEA